MKLRILSNEKENYGNVLIFVTFFITTHQRGGEEKMFVALSLVAETFFILQTNERGTKGTNDNTCFVSVRERARASSACESSRTFCVFCQ